MTATEQPELPLKPTPAWTVGLSRVDQCAWCGLLVMTPGASNATQPPAKPAGPCPSCGHDDGWWPQHLPVGTFTNNLMEADPR